MDPPSPVAGRPTRLPGSAPDYDTIVIGSGIGGLTAATLLARVLGERVLLVEQHTRPGGFTHTFQRRDFEWDVGVHYVGEMVAGSFPRRVLDLLTGGRLGWAPLPDPFDHFAFPEVSFGQNAGRERYLSDLHAAFPDDGAAIRAYFRDLDAAAFRGLCGFARRVLPLGLRWLPILAGLPFRRQDGRTLADSLARHVRNPRLAAVLTGQCGDHGLPPSRVALVGHAVVARHYLNGGFYPVGGPARIALEACRTLAEAGGEVWTSTEATGVVVEGRRVRGVRVRRGREEERVVSCRKVVSAVGARQTWLRLVGPQVEVPFRDELAAEPPGTTMVAVYLGLGRSPRELGFDGCNRWIFASTDLERVAHDPASACFLSFPSLKDPACTGGHTAQILSPVPYALFAPWAGTPLKRRGPDYEALKAGLAQKLLDLVESRHPGFRAAVSYLEVSSPLSVEHFTRHFQGEVYGLPATPARFARSWLGPRTPVRGLYLAGADVLSHGLVGAMSGGLVAVTASQGLLGVVRVFRAILASTDARAGG